MKNEYRAYNEKGQFIASYGLGWNLAEIMKNEYQLDDKVVEKVDLVIDHKVVSSVTRQELRSVVA